jgi:hypothetical protein
MKNEDSKPVELEIAPEYIKKMQTEGLFDGSQGIPPQFPLDVHYMQAYHSVKR